MATSCFNSTAISHVRSQQVTQSQSSCMRFLQCLESIFSTSSSSLSPSFIQRSNIWFHSVMQKKKKTSSLLSELHCSIIELNPVRRLLPVRAIISVYSLYYWPINCIYLSLPWQQTRDHLLTDWLKGDPALRPLCKRKPIKIYPSHAKKSCNICVGLILTTISI